MTKAKKSGWFVELVKTIVYALLIAFLFRTVLFQPFWIPSGSMKPTLLIGDYLFISKWTYGFSRASCGSLRIGGLDLDPCFFFGDQPGDGRLFGASPARGDVIVFKHPRTREDYIKRVVGLPGDTLQMRDGVLHVNGAAARMERLPGAFVDDNGRSLQMWRETLPDGVTQVILNTADRQAFDDTPEFVVPVGHYFFMGDNRDNSRDSREPRAAGGVGFVPFENLVGRAEIVAVSADGPFWALWTWRWGRTLTAID
jgi:signal peptidase I